MVAQELALSFALNVLSKLPRSLRESIMPDMRVPEIVNRPEKVQLARLSHVYFEHPNLDEFSKFASDFGFVLVSSTGNNWYFRGYGKDPYVYVASQSTDGKPHFGGPAFVAASREEFDKAKALPGGKLGKVVDAPGGGEIISFERADDTHSNIVFGQEERQIDTEVVPTAIHQETGPFNTPFAKPRKGE